MMCLISVSKFSESAALKTKDRARTWSRVSRFCLRWTISESVLATLKYALKSDEQHLELVVGHFDGLLIFFEFIQIQLVDEELLVRFDREQFEDIHAGELGLLRSDSRN